MGSAAGGQGCDAGAEPAALVAQAAAPVASSSPTSGRARRGTSISMAAAPGTLMIPGPRRDGQGRSRRGEAHRSVRPRRSSRAAARRPDEGGRAARLACRERATGKNVLGCEATVRAVALRRTAGTDGGLVPALGGPLPRQARTAHAGDHDSRDQPGRTHHATLDGVALFVSDLMAEFRASYLGVEAQGGRWVDADTLGSR